MDTVDDVDAEFGRARQESQGRVRSAFEAIFAKYGAIDEDDDIIDLRTGQLIVDNGRMRNLGVIELGDLLYNSQAPGLQGQQHTGQQPRFSASRGGSLSPELLSNSQLQQAKRRRGSAAGSDSPVADYDSSDSVDAGEGVSLDAYFTTSVEQYLGKLRQQITGSPPSPAREDSSGSDSSDSVMFLDSWHTVARQSLGRSADVQWRYAALSYNIPSSPHTMSSLPSNDGRRAAGNATWPGSGRVSDGAEYVSESASQASERSTENQEPSAMHTQPIHTQPVRPEGWHDAEQYPHPPSEYEESESEFSEEERFEPYGSHQFDTGAFDAHPDAADSRYLGYLEPEPYSRPPRPYPNGIVEPVAAPLAVSAPAIHKPQPVAPHMFFERDNAAPAYGWDDQHTAGDYEASNDDDDNASIHSGESLHDTPAGYGGSALVLDPAYYDLQLAAGAPSHGMFYAQ